MANGSFAKPVRRNDVECYAVGQLQAVWQNFEAAAGPFRAIEESHVQSRATFRSSWWPVSSITFA